MDKYIDKMTKIIRKENRIDPELYKTYNVKRGLRDEIGKGVIVGLTRISEVHGYLVDEVEKVPDEGRLLYRGYNIIDLVRGIEKEKRFGYEEVVYLILFGLLPNEEELKKFKLRLSENYEVSEDFIENLMLDFPSKNVMNSLQRAVLGLYNFDENPDDVTLERVIDESIKLIAKMPALMAYGEMARRKVTGDGAVIIKKPKKEYSIAENILYLLNPTINITDLDFKVLDLALILHAEHGGGNNSSFTNYVISSSGTDTYSAISAAIGSLKGPKHGGANKKVLEMMSFIVGELGRDPSEEQLKTLLTLMIEKKVFDKSGLIYGMGHAIYSKSDPRAVILKEKAKLLAIEKNNYEIFCLFEKVERISKDIFKEKKGDRFEICANVDFYSGFLYNLLGIPIELFTPIFAVSRTVGWCSHRIEQIVTDGKIIRPAYKSIYEKQKYVKIEKRV